MKFYMGSYHHYCELEGCSLKDVWASIKYSDEDTRPGVYLSRGPGSGVVDIEFARDDWIAGLLKAVYYKRGTRPDFILVLLALLNRFGTRGGCLWFLKECRARLRKGVPE